MTATATGMAGRKRERMQTTSLIRRAIATAGAALIATSVLAACTGSDSSGDDETLILYSGRSESLVGGPLVERIGGTIPVTAAYDKKAAQILEEGDRSPADLFFAQDAGELGALADAGLLEPLPADIVETVPRCLPLRDRLLDLHLGSLAGPDLRPAAAVLR